MLATLLDRSDGPALPLPAALAERYGGALRLGGTAARPHVFANFVASLDGVVSFALPGRSQAVHVSRGHPGDRFVLALLRSVADAVVVGAGTLREEPDSIWTPERVFPEAGGAFAALRGALGKAPRPLTVFVTRSGRLDARAPALAEGAAVLVLTSPDGARRLGDLPAHVRVKAIEGDGAADIIRAVAAETGAERVLTEGGPTLFGRFVRDRVVDELFLTVAPLVAGRSREERRIALVEGAAFRPEDAPGARLVAVKADGDYLFTRFALRA